MFELYKYTRINGYSYYTKEYENGRRVIISKRRYIKFIKGVNDAQD